MSSDYYYLDVDGYKTQIGRCGNGRSRLCTDRDPFMDVDWLRMAADVARDPAAHFREDGSVDEVSALRWLECFVGDVDLEAFARNVAALRACVAGRTG